MSPLQRQIYVVKIFLGTCIDLNTRILHLLYIFYVTYTILLHNAYNEGGYVLKVQYQLFPT